MFTPREKAGRRPNPSAEASPNSAMPQRENKNCRRCGSGFECNVDSILLCRCSEVVLTEAERDYLQANFDDCLCAKCLIEIKTEHQQGIPQAPSTST